MTVTGRNGQTHACTAMGRERLFQNNAIHQVACGLCFWDQPASGQIAELLGNCPLLEMVLMQLSNPIRLPSRWSRPGLPLHLGLCRQLGRYGASQVTQEQLPQPGWSSHHPLKCQEGSRVIGVNFRLEWGLGEPYQGTPSKPSASSLATLANFVASKASWNR